MSSKLYILLGVLFALQFTAYAQPVEKDKDSKEVADTKPAGDNDHIPNTPAVQEFKKGLIGHLIKSIGTEESDESGVYSAQLSSSEIDLPCTNDTVRISLISSNFRLPERYFHTPKKCSEEVQ